MAFIELNDICKGFEQKKKDENEVITKKPQKEKNAKDSYREYLELSKYTESDNDE